MRRPPSRSRAYDAGGVGRGGGLPRCRSALDQRRRRREQWLPGPRLEARTLALRQGAGLAITVCHLPPGTSKWNKIEHRLFSYISIHWRGRPLVDYETVVSLIGATSTTTGLTVTARLDLDDYPTGVTVPDSVMAQLALYPHAVHPQWNYTLTPRAT